MAESNAAHNLVADFASKCQTDIAHCCPIIILVDNKDEKRKFEQMLIEYSLLSKRPSHIFDDVDQCYDFVMNELCNDKNVKASFLVRDKLVNEIIHEIGFCPQIDRITILNDNPPSQEEKESVKKFAKVRYINDEKLVSSDNQTLYREILQEERFTEPITIASEDSNDLQKDINLFVEMTQRSSQCLLSSNRLLHSFTLRCLMTNQSMPPNHSDLIELLRREFHTSEENINRFKYTYAPDKAIQFFIREAFIFEPINGALCSMNINRLVQYRYIIKDIYDQLGDLMANEINAQTKQVFRGQRMHFAEMADLFRSFRQKTPIYINSFFSTSLKREIALGFLVAGYNDQQGMIHIPVLFTITIRKQDALPDKPFADISKLSTHHEEILFAAGQMFMIENFKLIIENDTIIYSIEMKLHNETDFNLNDQYNRTISGWKEETHDPLIHLARFLVIWQRYDEAKKLYEQVLNQKSDKQTQMVCYQDLAHIAAMTNNDDELMIYQQKAMDFQFGDDHSSSISEGILVPERFVQCFSTFSERFQNGLTQFSLNRPFSEMIDYAESDEWNELSREIAPITRMLIQALIVNQQYRLAISFLEQMLLMIRRVNYFEFGPMFKLECCGMLGHCYQHLGMNEKAREYYTLALNENTNLPTQDRINILVDIGKIFEEINQWEEALQKYIKAVEIYQSELPNADPEDVARIEKCIE